MRKILAAALMALVAPAADAAGFWAGRQAPKLPAIYHSVEGTCVGFYDLDGEPLTFDLTMKLLRQINELIPGHGYKLRLPDGKLAGWRHKSKGYPLKRPSPCAMRDTGAAGRHVAESRVLVEELPEPAIGCLSCYRAQGVICWLVDKAEVDIRLVLSDDHEHGDHGIIKIAQACRDLESRR